MLERVGDEFRRNQPEPRKQSGGQRRADARSARSVTSRVAVIPSPLPISESLRRRVLK